MARTFTSLLVLACLFFLPTAVLSQPSSTFDCEVITQVPIEECEALQLFYNSLDGLQWQYQTGWLRAGQPCEWHGVTCETGPWPRNVIKINLESNNLGGTIPGEISFLTELRELVIENDLTEGYFNQVDGWLPSSLGKLKNLEVLRITGHKIKGPIPVQISRLNNLKVLDLSKNELEGIIPDSLGFMQNLREFNVSSNNLLGFLPHAIGNLTNLEVLDVSYNDLAGPIPEELGQLRELKVLSASSNNFNSLPASIGNLTNLFSLSFANNRLENTLPPNVIRMAADLSICSLENNGPNSCIPDVELYRAEGRDTVCNLPLDATCSYCNGNRTLSDPSCVGLESLYYATNGLSWLENSGWLSTAYPCEWEGVQCADGEVISLLLADNNLDGFIPEELGLLTSLDTLDLSGNNLTGGVPLSVAFLESSAASCSLSDNHTALCMPSSPEYASISEDSICGLPLATACSVKETVVVVRSIEASTLGNVQTLKWRVDRLRSNIIFDIEQKIEGEFIVIASVEGSSIETSPLSYSYTLPQLSGGIHTFRIRIPGELGEDVFSETVGVLAFGPEDVLLEAPFPNPFSTTATLQFSVRDADRTVSITLYNMMGQRVRELYSGTPANDTISNIEISADGLASGIYFVRVESGPFQATRKLVVRRQ